MEKSGEKKKEKVRQKKKKKCVLKRGVEPADLSRTQ